MAEEFDPYRKWLGIPPQDQPPNHYRLLGIATFEDDPDVIENAASRQMTHVRTFQTGKHGAISQRILNELAAAKLCLLQPEKKKAYDEQLRRQMAAANPPPAAEAAVVEAAPPFPPPPPVDFRSSGGRWRTDNEQIVPPHLSSGPAPVPIPMPPAVPPPVTPAPPPLVTVHSGRKTSYPGRGRRSKSTMPVMLMFGAVGILAVAVVVAVMVAAQPKTGPGQSKLAGSSTEKSGKRSTSPPSSAPTNFPLGTKERPQRPTSPRSSDESTSNRPSFSPPPSIPAAPMVGQDPLIELTKARQALAARNDSDFVYHINQAAYLVAQQKPANADELKAEEEHLREVDKLLSSFWSTVREGVDTKIPKGEKISFRRHSLEIISKEGDQVTYRFDGVENVTPTKKLPPRVAMYIALRTYGQDHLDGKIAIVVFQLIDAEAQADSSSQRLARRLLEDIERAGAANNPVLARERGKAATPSAAEAEDLSGPLIQGTTPAPAASPGDQPAAAESKKPEADTDPLRAAREKFENEFRSRLLEAANQFSAKAGLLKELLERAVKEEGVEFKVKFLKEAGDLAAQLGLIDKVIEACNKIEELSGEDSLGLQAQYFRRTNLEIPGKARELMAAAQNAANQAQAKGDLFHAVEFLKIAKQAADKGNLAAEGRALEEKLQEAEKAKAERK
jgi:hypothetical protein